MAKTPPGRNSNSSAARFHTETPVTSEGSRSGVNWMRWQVPPIERRDRLGQRGLADAGDVLDEEVALGEQAHEREVHLFPLALDHALDVAEQGGEQAAERRVAARHGGGLNHEHLQSGPRRYQRVSRAQWQCSGERSTTGTVRTHDARAVGRRCPAPRSGGAPPLLVLARPSAVVDRAAPGGAAGPAAVVGAGAVPARARSRLPALPVRDPVRRRRPPRPPRPGRPISTGATTVPR